MDQKDNKRRRALKVLEEMISFLPFSSRGTKEVGLYIKRLSKEDRESLQHLKSEDLQKCRGWWTK